MGEFIGLFRRRGGGIDPALVDRLSNTLAGLGRPRRWCSDQIVLIHRAARAYESTDAASQPRENADGSVVAVDALLDAPDDLATQIGETAPARRGDGALVASAFMRWGAGAASHLSGPFAFAAWEPDRARLTLARDQLGAKSLFYVEHGEDVLFATTMTSLLALPMVSRALDELALAQLLTIERRGQGRPLYRDIKPVPAGALATFSAASSQVRQYWTVEDIAPVRFRSDADYVEAGRALLDQAVATRLRDRASVAIAVSGGLDSAGIAATAARLRAPGRVAAFHRAPAAAHPYRGALDERPLVEALATRYPNLDLTMIDDMVGSRFAAEPEAEAPYTQMPRLGGVNGRWFDTLMEAVAGSAPDVLLVGDAGNATLTWEGLPRVGSDLLHGRWARAWNGLRGLAHHQRRPLAAAAAAYFLRPLVPRPVARWRVRRPAGALTPWATYSMVSPDLLARLDYERYARATGVDIPFARRGDPRLTRLGMVRGRAQRDGVTGAARRHWRFDMRDPFADWRLVEFTLGLPDEQYSRGGEQRWLARRVLADRLPPIITSETRRGLQCPEWYDVVSARRDDMVAAVERIERSPLASGVVDVPRMKALLADWPADAEAAKGHKQVLGHALQRGIALGGFLRWYEGGNG
ncbi:MAG: asparagine synthase-related protein [Pseudomonadota bacterium]